METLKGQRFSQEIFKDIIIKDLMYDDCTFYKCVFKNVKWINCRFKNTSILGNSELVSCEFNNCRFYGQHTNMGGPTRYRKCEFLNSYFKNIQFLNTHFNDCKFTGKAENIVFYGKSAPKGWETIFVNVDLLELERELVDFRCEFDLSKTIIKN